MTDVTTDLTEAAEAVLDDVIGLRREIHREPELGLANPATRDRVLAALEPLGLDDIRLGPDDSTWVIADLVAGDGPTVLLRADTDALPMTEDTELDFRSTVPEAAHACGHDAHTAMLVGAARILADRRDDLAGTVRLVFQPGEEGFGGARHLVEAGATEGVAAAFAIHITPNIPAGYVASRPGAMMAAADELHITIRGKGGHASTPHFCTDPVTVAAETVTALQTMVTREVDAFDPAVLTIASIHAGTTGNVIPETAELHGTLRTFSAATRSQAHDAIHRVVAGIAAAHQATADVLMDNGYPVTVNDVGAVGFVAETADAVLGPGRYIELPTPIMGAEDFSYILEETPGAMVFLGVCPDDIADSLTAPPCHSNRMRLHEPALASGVSLLAGLTTRYLTGSRF